RLTAHAVSHQTDGHVRERLDVDGVLIVFAVVAQQGTLADVQRQGHEPTSPFSQFAAPRRTDSRTDRIVRIALESGALAPRVRSAEECTRGASAPPTGRMHSRSECSTLAFICSW